MQYDQKRFTQTDNCGNTATWLFIYPTSDYNPDDPSLTDNQIYIRNKAVELHNDYNYYPLLGCGPDPEGRRGLMFSTENEDVWLSELLSLLDQYQYTPPPPPPPTPDQQLKAALQALTSPTAEDIKNALLNWLTNQGV